MTNNKNLSNYLVFDLENPNSRGNSICSMGLVLVENNVVTNEIYFLINPEDRFDRSNEEINGITKTMVYNQPTLPDIWPVIKDYFVNNIVVGHNVTYDLSVLSKSLERYNIEVPDFNYLCTMVLSREYIESDSYSLSKLLEKYEYFYNVHNALDDTKACCYLFNKIQELNVDISRFISSYHYNKITKDKLGSKLENNINSLDGIIKGITSDGIVNDDEIAKLRKWVEENRINAVYRLFDNIIKEIDNILEDNIVTAYELEKLKTLVSSVNTSKIYSDTTLALQVLYGLLEGIVCDSQITEDEIDFLVNWINDNDYLMDVYPYDKVVKIVSGVIEDGIIDTAEKEELLNTFNEIINPDYANCDTLDFDGKLFCLTGEFKNGTKSEISSKIVAKGGIEKSSVTSKLDYLFVGGLGSDAWKYGKAGGKILKAQELQEKGKNIKIISEEDLTPYIK